jgi:hypothetical protein
MMTTSNKYTNEVVSSKYTYPKKYKGPKPIAEQVKAIATIFELNPKEALEFAKKLPTLPEGAEGWFAIPKVFAIAKKHFNTITDLTDPEGRYCKAVKLVHEKLGQRRDFINYLGEIVPSKLRQHARTVSFLKRLEAEQAGDILIIAAQCGMRHRGKSVRRARETFVSNEFGLCPFIVGCIALIHPELYVGDWEIEADCAGGEYSLKRNDIFLGSTIYRVMDGVLGPAAGLVSEADKNHGSATGFVTQV